MDHHLSPTQTWKEESGPGVRELDRLIVTVRETELTRTGVGLLRLQPESLIVLVALDTTQTWKGGNREFDSMQVD